MRAWKDVPGEDESLWEAALAEVESQERRIGLWAKCYSKADGDEAKAKAIYINERVQEMQSNHSHAEVSINKQPAVMHKLMGKLYFSGAFIVASWLIGCIYTRTDPSKIYLAFNYPLAITDILFQGVGALSVPYIIVYLLRRRKNSAWTCLLISFLISAFLTFTAA